jgi:hypothetical protein
MADDPFRNAPTTMEGPAGGAFAVTKGTPFAFAARALYVGVAGDVTLTTINGEEVTFVGVPAGTTLPVRCIEVADSGDSDSIIGLY